MKVGLKGAIFLKLSKSIISRMTKDIDLTLYLRIRQWPVSLLFTLFGVSLSYLSHIGALHCNLEYAVKCCKAVTGNEPPLTKNALKIHNFKSNYQNQVITLKKRGVTIISWCSVISKYHRCRNICICIYLLAHCCFLMDEDFTEIRWLLNNIC